MNDLIRLAMEQAVASLVSFDRETYRNQFDSAGFSVALTRIAGKRIPIDGDLVRLILTGRSDVKVLPRGSRFEYEIVE